MKNMIIMKPVVFCSIFIICSINAFATEQGSVNRKDYILSKLIPLAELMTSEKPSLKDAERLLGGPVERKKDDIYAYIHGDGYKFSARLTGPNDDPSILWCDIFFNQRFIDISFREIVPLLGEWKKVAISKTSLVRFSYPNSRTGNILVIYAHLDFPPKDPGSPVKDIKFIPQRGVE